MPMRAMFLSIVTLLGITLWGLAVYSEGAIAGNVPSDGYGVSVAGSDPAS